MRVALLIVLAGALLAACAPTPTEQVVEIATRGQKVRALLIRPENPIGGVVLLAGGHGKLALGEDGKIGWGAGNQLVRTRADYAKRGFVVLVPDIAPDLKTVDGVKPRYRWSPELAEDIGAYVRHVRGMVSPVHLVGTSRAALSVAKAATVLSGSARPDALVITAGMLVHISSEQPSVERNVGSLERITQPVLILYHEQDACTYTPASSAHRAKSLLTGAARVDIRIMQGGDAGSGNPCEAKSHHGFLGQDQEVVSLVSDWLKALPRR
jgi:dienelactone hydrolase